MIDSKRLMRVVIAYEKGVNAFSVAVDTTRQLERLRPGMRAAGADEGARAANVAASEEPIEYLLLRRLAQDGALEGGGERIERALRKAGVRSGQREAIGAMAARLEELEVKYGPISQDLPEPIRCNEAPEGANEADGRDGDGR